MLSGEASFSYHEPAAYGRGRLSIGIPGCWLYRPLLLDKVYDIFAVEKSEVLRAAEMVQNRASFSARDAVHIAVMEHHGFHLILSFDADFDRWPGLKRSHAI